MASEPQLLRAGARVATAEKMESIGAALGETLREGKSPRPEDGAVVIYLRGPLGAGKTTLARGVLRAFGVRGAVKSPTYTLVEPYDTAFGSVAHFDFYRLASIEEVEFLGMREYLDQGICLFEWPERAGGALPPADLTLEIDLAGSARELTGTASGALGRAFLNHLISRDLLQESVPNT